MKNLSMILIILLCGVLFISTPSCNKGEETASVVHDSKIAEAEASAEDWIKLIDAEKYGNSWESAAGILRGAVAKEKWIEAVSSARKPIGNIISRNAASKEFQKELPGVPDGEYVLIKYRSVFAKKKNSVELVTVYKEPDGAWKVAGYFVK